MQQRATGGFRMRPALASAYEAPAQPTELHGASDDPFDIQSMLMTRKNPSSMEL